MNTHWIALYLAGQYPGNHIPVNKIDIIFKIREIDDTNFTDFILGLQSTQSDVAYFKGLLDSFESKNGSENLVTLLDRMKVPKEFRDNPYEKNDKADIGKLIKEENKKTIGFITPFDGKLDVSQKFIKSILDKDYKGWNLKVAQLKTENGKFLWESIENFLNQYPVYIADMRNSNLNVALEIGYILGNRKENAKIIFIVDPEEKIGDLQGMIRISRKANDSIAGVSGKEAAKKQNEMNKKLKTDLMVQLDTYLK